MVSNPRPAWEVAFGFPFPSREIPITKRRDHSEKSREFNTNCAFVSLRRRFFGVLGHVGSNFDRLPSSR